MILDDIKVSKKIVEKFSSKLLDCLESDVAIVGGGPAGLVAGCYLARSGRKVVLLERRLAPGGGAWGGGMMFNEVVLQKEALSVLDDLSIPYTDSGEGYWCADSVTFASSLISEASKSGVTILNCISADDVMITDGRVTGLVINWTSVELAKLIVDPLTIRASAVIDATGHEAGVARVIERKSGCALLTETGKVIGEKPMCADEGERTTIENTRKIFAGVYVAGMSCNAVFGAPRMGPIFGGMLLSGKKVAGLVNEEILTGRLKN